MKITLSPWRAPLVDHALNVLRYAEMPTVAPY